MSHAKLNKLDSWAIGLAAVLIFIGWATFGQRISLLNMLIHAIW